MHGPTSDQYFVANDQDTLIEQSLTLLSSRVYFFLKLHNFNKVKYMIDALYMIRDPQNTENKMHD